MSTTIIELENKDIVVKMSGQGPIGPRGQQGEPGPAGPSEWGVITGNISDQTDLQNALDAKANVGASYTKSEENALLAQKADADAVYTKTETDALLADKADTDDVYSKTEVNTLLSGKADADTVYTKTETDTLLGAKADVGDSYTKTEEDALLAVKANSADVYTKTETDTLLADKADADDVYTKDEVDDALDLKADSADVYTKTETDTLLLDKAPVILNSASGSIASFPDGSASPVTALTVGIEPVQAGTGDPSPDNVRPISGHSTATVTRTGKNLCPDSWEQGSIKATAKIGDVDTYQNQKTVSDTRIRTTDLIYLDPNKTYTLSSGNGYDFVIRNYDSDGLSVYPQAFANQWRSNPTTITGLTAIAIMVRKDTDATITPSEAGNAQIQLELGSSASSFEPYQPIQTVTIDLDGTRYGGVIDVLTGTMTVNRAIVDMGTLTWDYDVNSNFFRSASLSNTMKKYNLNRTQPFVCSQYVNIIDGRSYASTPDKSVYNVKSGNDYLVCVRDTDYTTIPEFTSAMSGVQLVYELATPLTVQLTPEQLSTLLGTNNIFADTGDVAVKYRADTKLYIDSKFSQLQALILEN